MSKPLLICSGMVGTPGLEPGRLIQPTDFKSVVFTNFTMPPWFGILVIVLLSDAAAGVKWQSAALVFCCALTLCPRFGQTGNQTAAGRRERLFPVAAGPVHNQLAFHAAWKTAALPLPLKNRQSVWPQYKRTYGLPV